MVAMVVDTVVTMAMLERSSSGPGTSVTIVAQAVDSVPQVFILA